jgi:hypothetical protein
VNDFDFFTDTWDVANRWRTDFLDATSPWEEFPGITHASRHFAGGANIDEIEFPTKGLAGLTLRLYEASAHWEQAFSADAEATWVTKWVMDLTRRG